MTVSAFISNLLEVSFIISPDKLRTEDKKNNHERQKNNERQQTLLIKIFLPDENIGMGQGHDVDNRLDGKRHFVHWEERSAEKRHGEDEKIGVGGRVLVGF